MKTAELIQHDVVDALAWDPAVDSSTIGVTAAADGVVTLSGRVEGFTAKIAAEQAVKRVKGVQAVVNELDLGSESRNARDDTAIARAAVDALLWTITVPIDDKRVTVENGWANGFVSNGRVVERKRSGGEAAGRAPGVVAVENHIKVQAVL